MQPFKLKPYYAEYLWGGRKLKREFNKSDAPAVTAESWELSARPGRASVITTGGLSGLGFDDFVRKHANSCSPLLPDGQFPMLIKLLDVEQNSSIQVHPDDAYALRAGELCGKTEAWVILDCEKDAFIYHGFKQAFTKDEVAGMIQSGTLSQALRAVPVKPGDAFFIPAGTVHMLGAGIVLAEIQQNSDTIFRVFDFGRLGSDYKPRELHIEQALEVMRLMPEPEPQGASGTLLESSAGGSLESLIQCPYFNISRLRLSGSFEYKTNGGFAAMLCVDGFTIFRATGRYAPFEARIGETIFVPTDCESVMLTGQSEILIVTAGL